MYNKELEIEPILDTILKNITNWIQHIDRSQRDFLNY
jgi:hypothetical protein